jgi:predicted aconitase
MELSDEERAQAGGASGTAAAMAMRIVAESGRMLGAPRLIAVASAHIDGCLYHGDSGTAFAERLVAGGGQVAVPATLNVGALDLLNAGRVKLAGRPREMAERMMRAYLALGCRATWTCAPYQAGHRPAIGSDVAWGESNAVAFCNSVLGARTNRYGDFLDICCALTARAPFTGLHLAENRRARLLIDASGLDRTLVADESFYPVLGAWLGATAGGTIAAIDGLPSGISEDRLKALGAAAASTGAVALFHVIGTTPEAPDRATAFHGRAPDETIRLTGGMLRSARDRLSTGAAGAGQPLDAVAIGSPHLSVDELDRLLGLIGDRRLAVPIHACTGRHALDVISGDDRRRRLESAGVELIADTCVVVTPILPAARGLLMTNSGKFAHYVTPNTGYAVVYGSLADCVESACAGRVVRDERPWH